MLLVAPPDWKRYSPDPTPEGEPTREVEPYAPPGPKPVRSLEERTVRRYGAGPLLVRAVALVVTIVVIGLVGWIAVDLVKLAFDDSEPQTADGFAEMVDELGEETGGAEVFSAVIYPEYAVLDVPVGEDDRYVGYRWDGSLSETTKSTSDDVRFDLADIDPSGFADMCEEAEGLVDDPGDCYLIISRPDPDDTEQGWISAYVSNEFSQGGYVEYDLDGVEVGRQTW